VRKIFIHSEIVDFSNFLIKQMYYIHLRVLTFFCFFITGLEKDMRMNRTLKYFFPAVLSLCIIVYHCIKNDCYGNHEKKTEQITVSGTDIEVELAITPEEHMAGLMYRNTLEDNKGMLFVFPDEKRLSFWMKNTYVPLSVAFIDENGRITQIETMKPRSLDLHDSREKVRYALEMKSNWFEIHNVREGDVVKMPPRIIANGESRNGKNW